MKNSLKFLIIQSIIIFLLIIFIDFSYMTKFVLAFLWITWTWLVSIEYAIITREEVDCRCFDEDKKNEDKNDN